MTLNIENFQWTREPESCVIKEHVLRYPDSTDDAPCGCHVPEDLETIIL